MARLRYQALWLVLAVACGDSESTGPPASEVPLPKIEVSLGFDDSPVEGELFLSPIQPGIAWRFEIDLDDDGTFEIDGLLDDGATIPYRFTEIGVHRIGIRLEIPGRKESLDEFVVVNDPDAVSLLARADLFEGTSSRLLLGGIATDGETVFVAEAPGTRTIHRLEAGTLAPLGSRPIPGTALGDMLGFSIVPNRDRLFIAEDIDRLDILSLPDLELRDQITVSLNRRLQYVQATSGRVYAGSGGIVLIEPTTGEVLFQRSLAGGGHFAVSPDDAVMVLVDQDQVRLVDAASLVEVWTTRFQENESPTFVAFSPHGEVVYAVVFRDLSEQSLVLAVLDQGTGEILRRVALGEFRRPFASNPIATSSDGRFIAIPTFSGAFFIDTTLDLVRYRTVEPDLRSPVGCCNAVAGSESGVFYFSGGGPTGASVHKVLVQP